MWEALGGAGAIGAVLVAVIYGWPAFRRELAQRREPATNELTVEGWLWCLESGISAEQLLADLISLDYSSVPGLDGQSEGHVAQWAPVFEASPETWRLIVSGHKIVAYWSFFSLAPALQEKLLAGELYDSEIVHDKIRTLRAPATHDLYIPMFGMHKWYKDQRRQIFRLLLKSFYDQVHALEAQGIQFQNVYANAFTEDGASLARSLGFEHVAYAKQGGDILGRRLDADLKQRVKRLLRL